MTEESSPYATLAEILTSKRVGLLHVKLVGELIVAQSQLNEWLAQKGLPPNRWSHIIERTLECEDHYKAAWQTLNTSPNPLDPTALHNLATALHEATTTFTTLRTTLDT